MIKKNIFKFFIIFLFINISSGSLHCMEPKDIRPFRITNLEDKLFDSRSELGEPIVISFFFTRCPPCWEEMPQLFTYMKKENKLDRLLFVDSYVDAKGIEVSNPDTRQDVEEFAEKLKIDPANVYFDTLGSLLKKFIKIGAFPKAKATKKTKIMWPTILVISATGKLVESIEGSRPDFLEIIDKHL